MPPDGECYTSESPSRGKLGATYLRVAQRILRRGERVAHPQPHLLTRTMLLFFLAFAASFVNFYLLFSVIPLYAVEELGRNATTGLPTGVMLLTVVVVELFVPAIVRRLGYRVGATLGAALLSVPVLAVIAIPDFVVLLIVSCARGAGIALLVVIGTALAAELSPVTRLGATLGAYGIAVNVPSIVGLPLGVWLAKEWGFTPVFYVAVAVSLLSIVLCSRLPQSAAEFRNPAIPRTEPGSVLSTLRMPSVRRPALIFAGVTVAVGVFTTFMPIAIGDNVRIATVALLLHTICATVARWIAGIAGDRRGSSHSMIVPLILLSSAGAASASFVDSPIATIVGMSLLGVSFGMAQTVTLRLMLEGAEIGELSRFSAIWNIAYDAGLGLGAAMFGYLLIVTGFETGFAIIAILQLLLLIPTIRRRL